MTSNWDSNASDTIYLSPGYLISRRFTDMLALYDQAAVLFTAVLAAVTGYDFERPHHFMIFMIE